MSAAALVSVGPPAASATANGSVAVPPKGRAHEHDGAKDVRPGDRTPGSYQRSEVVAGQMDLTVAERRHQPEHVPHLVQHPERAQLVVVAHVGAVGAAVPAQVGRDDVVPSGRRAPA